MDDRRWGEWSKGKPMSRTQLSTLLAPFEVYSTDVRIGNATAKGYYRTHFDDAFAAYTPGPAATSRQSLQDSDFSNFQSATTEIDVALQKSRLAERPHGLLDIRPLGRADRPVLGPGSPVSLEAKRTEVEAGPPTGRFQQLPRDVTRSPSVAKGASPNEALPSAAASFPTVKQRSPGWDELEQHIVVADICGQQHQAKLPRLQEQHTVLERTQLRIFVVPLEAT
jgi:hypothetical protein